MRIPTLADHERHCPLCRGGHTEYCREATILREIERLRAERDDVREEFDRLAPALPVLDGIVRLMQSIQQSGKPHGCELLVRDGNVLLKGVTLWGAYGLSNPLDRIAQLVAERDDARARLDAILLLTEADK